MPPPSPATEARSGSLEPGRPSRAQSANTRHPAGQPHMLPADRMYVTDVRQTDVRQHHCLIPTGRGHNKEIQTVVQRKERVVNAIQNRKFQLFGHICRMPYDRLLKTLLFGMIEGERRPGRPARRWIDDILKWCGKDLRDAATITEDRIEWRRLVTSPYGPC